MAVGEKDFGRVTGRDGVEDIGIGTDKINGATLPIGTSRTIDEVSYTAGDSIVTALNILLAHHQESLESRTGYLNNTVIGEPLDEITEDSESVITESETFLTSSEVFLGTVESFLGLLPMSNPGTSIPSGCARLWATKDYLYCSNGKSWRLTTSASSPRMCFRFNDGTLRYAELSSETNSYFKMRFRNANNQYYYLKTPHGEYGSVSAGTYTWTVPANVTMVTITLVGGGGAGSDGKGSENRSGSGGGSGYQARVTNLSVEQGEVFTISVGQGGRAGSGHAKADDGSATYLHKNGTHILAANPGGGAGGSEVVGGGLCNGGKGHHNADHSGYDGSASPTSTIYYPIGSPGSGGSVRYDTFLGVNVNGYAGGGGGGAGTKLTINGTTYNNRAGNGASESSGGNGGYGGTGVGAGGGGGCEPDWDGGPAGGAGNPGGFVITW
jgi:hypothetical protein